MRGAEDAIGKSIRTLFEAGVIGNEALPEGFVQRADPGFQFLQDPCGKFLIVCLVGFYAVENRRLYVGDDKPVEVIKDTAFDNFYACASLLVRRHIFRALLPEKKGYDHLVSLLVDLEEFHGAQLIIPSAHAGP